MPEPHIWLRAETKPQEHRTALTPDCAATLLKHGFRVTVENSQQNCFPIAAYRDAGCVIARAGSWTAAPRGAYILGLKELPDADFPLHHRHIYFAHAYKGQAVADRILRRFTTGGGTLFDLEFLTDASGRRVAAFGYWAGFAGAALAVEAWAAKSLGVPCPLDRVRPLASEGDLLARVAAKLEQTGRKPTLQVIGAKGRSGTGACAVAQKLGLPLVAWDMEETRHGGPFPELNQSDILVNCVLLGAPMPPFLTRDTLDTPYRKLSVIADVSCDPTSPCNPLPIYDACTTFDAPCVQVSGLSEAPHVIAIDHLPSLLPKESSEDYGNQLLPHLLMLSGDEDNVWHRARDIFDQHTETMKAAS